jgi:glutathione S-transferase
MITIHHLENSRSLRVLWLLEELGVAYEVKHYQRDPKTSLAPPELLHIHPLGKAPVITDGDIVIAETGAIIEYLVDVYDDGRMRPASGTADRRQYTYWLHYAEGTLMPYMVFSLVVQRVESAKVPFFIKPITRGIAGKIRSSFLAPNIDRNLEFINGHLESNSWFCGENMSAADVQMSFPLQAARSRIEIAQRYPAIDRFVDTIENLPSFVRATEKGGALTLPKRAT